MTFYTRRGDVFSVACAIISLLLLAASFVPANWGKQSEQSGEF